MNQVVETTATPTSAREPNYRKNKARSSKIGKDLDFSVPEVSLFYIYARYGESLRFTALWIGGRSETSPLIPLPFGDGNKERAGDFDGS
jgi:hypothetical protein